MAAQHVLFMFHVDHPLWCCSGNSLGVWGLVNETGGWTLPFISQKACLIYVTNYLVKKIAKEHFRR